MKILVVGGGNMGMTYAQSFIKSHVVKAENMLILEKSLKKAEELRKTNIGTVHGEPGPFIKEADLIILAVKPQDIKALAGTIAPFIDGQQLVLSIMAGVTITSISELFGVKKIVRAMPNLPAQVGIGMTVFTSSNDVTRIELVTVQNLLNATGKAIYADAENMINAATAISGSGPAYVFHFMQSLIEAAKDLDFTQAEAELLTYQTFKGTIDLFNKYDFTCEEWIQKVSSRGGTTEAAFKIFESEKTSEKIKLAAKAAMNRAVELSNT